ncbi:MAG: histidinol-phosphate transaminase [Planctomycetes bacterium]|nr:histidinol-phosphate transaminase [Planctomycetota bacterium]
MSLVRDNIATMTGYIPGEQPDEGSVIKLNTNENPYPSSPRVLEAIQSVRAEQLRRYPNPDARAFRQAAAQVHGVTPDMILCTNGGDELLALVFRACVGDGDKVAFLDPSYSLYPVLAAMQAAKLEILPYRINGEKWEFPPRIFQLDAKLLLIVNPNAPSGTRADLATLARIIHGFPGVVLVDEAYVDFAPASALPLVRDHANVILLRSMSKGYGLAGMRFGYGIAQASLLAELYKVRDSYPCDAVATAAATAAIMDQAYAADTWEKVKLQRAAVSAALRNLGFVLPESYSNFVLARVPPGANAEDLYQRLKAAHILVRYFNLPGLTDKLRITIGTAEQNAVLLATLEKFLAR